MSNDPEEIHNLNYLSFSVLATRRNKSSMGNHSFIGCMKTDYKPNLFTITKHLGLVLELGLLLRRGYVIGPP
jgi:hypothetical protein